ncbi:HAD family hydrolase [Nocardiopsis sp. EMB25]|uniref:HAD family hydrolase n=1 Tax=Nocardiopsis TaxID=2013 RepID=UPI00034B0A42|nr:MULTISPECIES: HAD family hydrolase [Nocardiopsis]MCY9787216.1 HAD family hydrolase [Nocardiopsis sp. EMB25]
MPPRPVALAFDVLDTLFPLGPLEWRFREAGIPRVLMTRWSDHVLRDTFALALLDGDRSFEDVARGSLRDITGHQIAPAAEDSVIEGMARLEPRSEAVTAVTAAREAGLRVVTLGNGDERPTRELLERAGILDLVDGVLGGASAGAWKPAAAPYLAAARELGVDPRELGLVTAHGWDVGGAARAGLVTGWSAHLEGRFPAVFPAPDVSGRDLEQVVKALLDL